MPIYMDRHEMPEEITAEHIAMMHQADLKVEHKFNCRGLTYWCDEHRKTAFCLVEAPDAQSVHDMHDHAHGEVPHTIIEVDGAIVESFLGRISDPVKAKNTELNIINEPAFRTIMVTEIKLQSLKNSAEKQLNQVLHNHSKAIMSTISKFKGRLVKQKSDYYLSSFNSVTNAVLCAIEIRKTNDNIHPDIELSIGLSAGIPVTDKSEIFEDTINMAEYLCETVDGKIVITSEVKDLYESENLNIAIDKKSIHSISASDENFLGILMNYVTKNWTRPALKASDFCTVLGYSKSKLYRQLVAITGKSPNNFIKEYRLAKALKLLDTQTGNISEIAFKTGFNTPAYFSKCFLESYGVLPSIYTKQHNS